MKQKTQMRSLIVFLFIFATITLKSNSQYLLPITKHEPTKQFYTTFNIGSAAKSPVNLLLDLGTNLTWLDCRKIKSLSSLRVVTCHSSTCKSISGNSCDGKTCLFRQQHPLGPNSDVTGRVVQDRASISTTDGGKLLSQVSLPHFTFSCSGEKTLQGLAPPVAGVLGLSPGVSSFTRQVTSAFNVIPKFSLCLPSSGTGHFYIAGVHYLIPPFSGSNNPIPMTSTLLRGVDSGNYLISVQSIYVDGTPLSLKNPNLLSAGAKLSTVVPYTLLHTHIYNALAQSFTLKAEAMRLIKLGAMGPFKDCFEDSVSKENVPVIDIGLPGRAGEVKWRFHSANTVVRVLETVVCLAFVDGGKNTKDSIVIGTHQLQDYMLEFDFSRTMFTFSDSLLLHNTTCSTWPSQH